MKTSIGFLLAAAILAQPAAAQNSDPLRFLPPGAAVMSIVSDSAGNLYAGGSLDNHGFVAKLSATGPARVLYKITGSGNDYIRSIVLGPAGAIFAAGTTQSPEFPATTPPVSRPSMNDPRAFILKLDADGNLAYATLIGGSQTSVGSSAGAAARRLLLGLFPRFPSSCPFRIRRGSVSSARHIARSVRISRTTRSCTVHDKVYGAYQTVATAEIDCP
jgi:hypothetical protein